MLAVTLLGGCATSRSVVAVGTTPAYQSSNPAEGIPVKLTAIDARVFEARPATPDIPSLKNGEITNAAITSRAIARKRNGYGRALGDVLLPEGQTVADIVGSAVGASFKEAGYRVVKPGEQGFDEALPVEARINQYWSWMNPGFWTITLSCRAEVTVTAPLAGFEEGRKILATAEKSGQAAFEDDWQDVANQGLAELTRVLSREIPRQTAAR